MKNLLEHAMVIDGPFPPLDDFKPGEVPPMFHGKPEASGPAAATRPSCVTHRVRRAIMRSLGSNLELPAPHPPAPSLAQLRSDEFLAVMAHELRNPLAPVRNAVEILNLAGLTDPRLQHASDIIGRQVEHMARLVDDLMDAGCLSHGKLTLQKARCDVVAIVRDAAADYHATLAAAGQRLFVHGCDDPIWTVADATRIAQILGNLLGNAARFQAEPGVVVVQAEVEETGSVTVTVCDTGLGIGADLLGRVFDPFVQGQQDGARSKGGLGLGLTLARGLAELHGGKLTAASPGPGRGSSFTLHLPSGSSR